MVLSSIPVRFFREVKSNNCLDISQSYCKTSCLSRSESASYASSSPSLLLCTHRPFRRLQPPLPHTQVAGFDGIPYFLVGRMCWCFPGNGLGRSWRLVAQASPFHTDLPSYRVQAGTFICQQSRYHTIQHADIASSRCKAALSGRVAFPRYAMRACFVGKPVQSSGFPRCTDFNVTFDKIQHVHVRLIQLPGETS